MPLGQQAARGVDHPVAAIGAAPGCDKGVQLVLPAQPQRDIGGQLVAGETVVQFDDVDIFRADAGILIGFVRRIAAQGLEHDIHHAAFEETAAVAAPAAPGQAYVGADAMGTGELRGADDHGGCAATRRAGVVLAQPTEEGRCGKYLFDRQWRAEDGVLIVGGVPAGIDANRR
ncbi:hypothetical protein D9M68_776870 [compost metagenome]